MFAAVLGLLQAIGEMFLLWPRWKGLQGHLEFTEAVMANVWHQWCEVVVPVLRRVSKEKQ